MRLISGAVPILIAACAAAAQTPPEPTPQRIIQRMRAAIAQLDAVAYNARFFGKGSRAGSIIEAEGRVVLQRVNREDGIGANLRVDSIAWKPGLNSLGHEIMRYAGGSVWRLDAETGQWIDRGAVGAGGERYEGFGAFLWKWPQFAEPEPFARLDLALDFEREADAAVAGVACFVIRVDMGAASYPRRYFIAKGDFLPRRIEHIEAEGRLEVGASVLEISGLRGAAPVAPGGKGARRSGVPVSPALFAPDAGG